MLNRILWLSALCVGSLIPAQGKYLFSTNFNSGRIPAVMSTADLDGTSGSDDDYRYGNTDKGWTVTMISGGQYAAVSPSHTRSEVAQCNTLSTPSVSITGTRPMLRWRGRSVHPDFPEKYSVLVHDIEADTDAVLLTVEEESDVWRTRAIDLSQYIGRNITVTFRCESINRYLLAIDDIMIGDPEEISLIATPTSPEYIGLWGKSEDYATISGTVSNMGIPLSDASLVCVVDSRDVDTLPIPGEWRCGQTQSYSFSIPVSLNAATPYTIYMQASDGTRTPLMEHRVFASHFPRTLLVDEYTGLWCNNCPKGILDTEALQRRFHSQIITLGVHINDALQCDDYRNEVSVYSIPYMTLNRNADTGADNTSKFNTEFDAPTIAHISIDAYTLSARDIAVKASVTMAETTDNTSDRYRIGYLLTHDVVTTTPKPSLRQENSLSTVASDRFYFLPSKIASDLSPNHHVVATGLFAHTGRPYTLPKSMEGLTPIAAEWNFQAPDVIEDLTQTTLVAYVLDSSTGIILNAVAQPLDRQPSASLPSTSFPSSDALPEYFTLSGIRVSNPSRGLYIVRRGHFISKEFIQ